MAEDKILITGASGQIGSILSIGLIEIYGYKNVILSDIKPSQLESQSVFETLDVTNSQQISSVIEKHGITQIYHLAAILSATGEVDPIFTWNINMGGLIHILEAARVHKLEKMFIPSSIAVYGHNSELDLTSQYSYQDPSTLYGLSKTAGELWGQYYFDKYELDVRSLRYPGLISYESLPGGGTTDYAVDMFHGAIKAQQYTCYLSEDTRLPMMYIDDAIRGTLELMRSDPDKIKIRSGYNFSGFNFTPQELADEIKLYIPEFKVDYEPDHRQLIADSWPDSIDDSEARQQWGWSQEFGLKEMVKVIIESIDKNKPTLQTS